jgi:hypothetical protein
MSGIKAIGPLAHWALDLVRAGIAASVSHVIRCWRPVGPIGNVVAFGLGLAPSIWFTILPRVKTVEWELGSYSQAMLVVVIVCCLGLAGGPVAIKRTKSIASRIVFCVILAVLFLINCVLGLDAVGELRRQLVAPAKEVRGEVDRLNRLLADARERRKWVPDHRTTTQAMVDAAEQDVANAARSRDAECSKKNGGRGNRCNDRENAVTQATNQRGKALADKAATDQAKLIKEEIDALNLQLAGKRVSEHDDSHMWQIAKLLELFGAEFGEKKDEEAGEWAPLVFLLVLEFFNIALPSLFRAWFLGCPENGVAPREAAHVQQAATASIAPRSPLETFFAASAASPCAAAAAPPAMREAAPCAASPAPQLRSAPTATEKSREIRYAAAAAPGCPPGGEPARRPVSQMAEAARAAKEHPVSPGAAQGGHAFGRIRVSPRPHPKHGRFGRGGHRTV